MSIYHECNYYAIVHSAAGRLAAGKGGQMNEGKVFEQDFKKSVPEDVYYLRLHDSSIGFDIENSTQRFALKSPYDVILFRYPVMYCLELKSTKSGRVSFAGTQPMIRDHQIRELIKAAQYQCRAGFVINFRDTEHTYYIPISSFSTFAHVRTEKKSMNETDARGIGVQIPQRKLKVHYRYDLSVLF